MASESEHLTGTGDGQPFVINEDGRSSVVARVPEAPALSQWDRLLRDPSVDVAKLQALFALYERDQARQAKAAFESAFAQMQGELPTIDQNGRAVMPDGKVRYTHATQEDIVEAVRPILQRHGFSLRFRHKHQENGTILVIGILSHVAGHSEEDEFPAQPDTSGSKNAIQAIGSTRTYGQRYTTRALLNIVSRDPSDPARDTDGHRQAEPTVVAPQGYEESWFHLMAAAKKGLPALTTAWNQLKPEFKRYLNATNRAGWDQLKEEAGKVKA